MQPDGVAFVQKFVNGVVVATSALHHHCSLQR